MQIAEYRREIDGLRAIAVTSVVLYHFGYLDHGYLGVDVFFVISGYLITGIIHREVSRGEFSFPKFYERRVRRILPLVTFICFVALILGLGTMLPDDLENLCQSVVATNFFANNILQAITTRNYWDVVNEFKPLMHTWSLAVEEQFYFFYPILITSFRTKASLVRVLIVFSACSFALCLLPIDDAWKFYFLPFRFFELSLGGLTAITRQQPGQHKGLQSAAILLSLVLLLSVKMPIAPVAQLVFVVVLTSLTLAQRPPRNSLLSLILENRIANLIGKLSFSIYMWHQVILSFVRYTYSHELSSLAFANISLAIVGLSALSYRYIEQKFRDPRKTSTRNLLWCLVLGNAVTTGAGLAINYRGGVIRDVPELGIRADNAQRNSNSAYNERIRDLDTDFAANSPNSHKLKVLVVGNSFARDWANVLLESHVSSAIIISYSPSLTDPSTLARAKKADLVFIAGQDRRVVREARIPLAKAYCLGLKNFGRSNGVFYNYQGAGYTTQRTLPEKDVLQRNASLKTEWSTHYIDLLGPITDESGRVPVFSNGQFISQDCRHLTPAGAKFYAKTLTSLLEQLIR